VYDSGLAYTIGSNVTPSLRGDEFAEISGGAFDPSI
jgi:hypothetical protein